VPPELPRTFLNTSYPVLSTSHTVRTVEPACSSAINCYTSLQDAIDAAILGDEIVVRAGMNIPGPITLKNKTIGTGWIIIRSSNMQNLPGEGSRVGPKNAPDMAKILATGKNTVALETENNAHNYRIVGIEFAEQTPDDDSNVLIELGNAESQCATTEEPFKVCSASVLDSFAHDIILDRVYIHGSPAVNVKRGVSLNDKSSSIIDSYISEIHVVGQDSQAVYGANGPGPFKIVNNYLEAAGENILFGGDDPRVDRLIPSDIEIRDNHFYKPLSWRYGDASYNGRHWAVKNILEIKNGQRIIIDGNIFENNWSDGQTGIAILFNTTNQDGRCSWCAAMDITFSNNIVRHVGGGIASQANDWHFPLSEGRTQRIKIYNNLFEDIDAVKWKDLLRDVNASGNFFNISSGSDEPGPDNFEINHNTIFESGKIMQVDDVNKNGGFLTKSHFVFVNNIVAHNTYGVSGQGDGFDNSALLAYFPDGIFTKNIIKGGTSTSYTSFPGNFFPAEWSTVFVNQAGGDYSVLPPYKNAGTDGKDIGADINVLNLKTANAVQH
jgi:hypothetical protein